MALILSTGMADPLLLAILSFTFALLSIIARGFAGDRIPHGGDLADEPETSGAHYQVMPVEVPVHTGDPGRARPLLSVDVEDYFQTEAMSMAGHRKAWDLYPLRVVDNTKRLLDLFDEFDAKATFFTLGWIADRVPSLVREIAARGHEIACHSYWHRTIYSLSQDEFRSDTRQAVGAIQNACGIRVRGYRAPTWSITRNSLWAIQILAEEGYEYDSSVYPIHHELYGIPGATSKPQLWKFDCGQILEIPPATFSLGNLRLPAAGGGYLRILPLPYSSMAIDQLHRDRALPVVYLHPWEIDPEQPHLEASFKSRFRQYWGLKGFEARLRSLLSQYEFVRFSDQNFGAAATMPEFAREPGTVAVAS